MFSGIAPLPVILAKNTKAKKITAVEINPKAHKYALENIKLNKITNVDLINSDINKVKLKQKFDRILMPLPKSGEEFLPLALKLTKKGTIINYYNFLSEDQFKEEKKYIVNLLESTKGNVSKASELAGKYRADFYLLLKKYHIKILSYLLMPRRRIFMSINSLTSSHPQKRLNLRCMRFLLNMSYMCATTSLASRQKPVCFA